MQVSTATLTASAALTTRDALRARLDDLGWTQTALAEAAGVSQGHLSNFFAGRKDLTGKSLDRLAMAMGGWPKVWMSAIEH